ncbi:MAG: zinc ribbon domain-containing protein [Phycisphaeraceae bacterium]|nr:zinc ribbon domain-containing protein [Phycisphaeraceae bacterium]
MPVYEYVCQNCGATTEALRSMKEADDPIACGKCGGKKTRRAHSVFSAAVGSGKSQAPAGPCGRCGDPNGSCPFR